MDAALLRGIFGFDRCRIGGVDLGHPNFMLISYFKSQCTTPVTGLIAVVHAALSLENSLKICIGGIDSSNPAFQAVINNYWHYGRAPALLVNVAEPCDAHAKAWGAHSGHMMNQTETL